MADRRRGAAGRDTDDEKERIAQEKYGKSYEELDGRQRQSVAGTVGGLHRREELGREGYSELGHKGGQARRAGAGTGAARDEDEPGDYDEDRP
jgi:general stress protein YciG